MRASRALRTLAVSATLLTSAVLGVGCGGGGETLDMKLRADVLQQAGEAREHGFDRLAEALEDGRYTRAENAALFSLYEECVTKAGIELEESYLSPIDSRSILVWPEEGQEYSAAQGEEQYQCLHRYLAQGPVFGEDPGPMAEPLRRFVLDCLEDSGERVDPSDRSMRDVMSTAGGNRAQGVVGGCIDKGMRSEYPDMGFGYGMPSIF